MNGTLNNLIKISQREEIPSVHVSDDVITRIKQVKKINSGTRPLGIMAAISSLAASIILVAAVHIYQDHTDPLALLTAQIEWVYEDYGFVE